jgi:hypothetical protein
MPYNIFLSYRRKGGYETAKHLYDLLSREGYKVSFDIDTLRSGDFDTELLKRIDECTDFVLILNQGAFDRCFDSSVDPKQDWLRNELAYAISKGKNIIPVMLNDFEEYPNNMPADIAPVVEQKGPKYDQYYFNDFYKLLKKDFLQTPPPRKNRAMIVGISILTLLVAGLLLFLFLQKNDTSENTSAETDTRPVAPENLLQVIDGTTSIDFITEHFGEPMIEARNLPNYEKRGFYLEKFRNLTEQKYTWSLRNVELIICDTKGEQTIMCGTEYQQTVPYVRHKIEFNLTGEANLQWTHLYRAEAPFGVAIFDSLGYGGGIETMQEAPYKDSDGNYIDDYVGKFGAQGSLYVWISTNPYSAKTVLVTMEVSMPFQNWYGGATFASNENILSKLSEPVKAKLEKKNLNKVDCIFSQSEIQEIKDAVRKMKITSISPDYLFSDVDTSQYQLILVPYKNDDNDF